MDKDDILRFINGHDEGHIVHYNAEKALYAIREVCLKYLREKGDYEYAGFVYCDNSEIPDEILYEKENHIRNDAYCIIGAVIDRYKPFKLEAVWVNRCDFVEDVWKIIEEPD